MLNRRTLVKSGALALGAAPFVPGCAHDPGRVRAGSIAGVYNVRDYGAQADGKADDTPAFQSALDQAARAGGVVLVPPGTYHLRPIRIGSRTTLRLERGALLKASPRLDDYPKVASATSHESSRLGLIHADGAEDIAIVGGGVIDGHGTAFVMTDNLSYPGKDHDPKFTRQGERFMTPPPGGFPHGPYARGNDRPGNPIYLRGCRNVHLEGFTIQNAPVWNCHLENCVDVLVSGLHITSRDSDYRMPNDDGIDLTACSRVRIVGCDIDTGDDCIAIFGSEDVVVSTCTLHARSAGVRVGYIGKDTKRCSFDNLVIRDSHRGLLVCVRGSGSIEDISFSNITIETRHYTGRWWGKGEPIHVSALLSEAGQTRVGQIRNVRFNNISVRGQAGMVVYGTKDSIVRDVSFENVRFLVTKGDLQADYGGNFDLRGAPDKSLAIFKHDIPALHAESVAGLRVDDFSVAWEQGLPEYFTDGVVVEKFDDVVIEGFEGRQAHGAGAGIVLREGRGAIVRRPRALPGTDALVRHEKVEGDLVIEGADARNARTLVDPPGAGGGARIVQRP